MSKIKFYFNTKSLTYEQVQLRFWDRAKRILSYLATGLVFAAITMLIAYNFFSSPKEKRLKREIEQLTYQYDLLDQRMNQMGVVMQDMQDRDDNIYRTIFEAEPIAKTIRESGFGGVDRYNNLEGFDNTELLKASTQKLDILAKQMYVQSKSFDEVVKLARNKQVLLASMPAIQPISNKQLKQMASGFGYRIHPIYKTQDFHPGIDFSAVQGTPIYATGDGVVERADNLAQGYGNHIVIKHGFGFETLYGHMSRFAVRAGQKVKRGEVIGYVGSTGLSTAPHVHYEVIKNGDKINPINYFYNDISPAQYQQLIELASKANQSFD
jgi:murein DD-endopeptidase MepM/ murein hydrolase activator NlpD